MDSSELVVLQAQEEEGDAMMRRFPLDSVQPSVVPPGPASVLKSVLAPVLASLMASTLASRELASLMAPLMASTLASREPSPP